MMTLKEAKDRYQNCLPPETVRLIDALARTELFVACERCYSFGKRIYDKGQWLDEHKNPDPPGTAYLGIVLDKHIEISIAEAWNGEGTFHRPNAFLRQGDIFGTFEACDVLNHTPPAQNYTVYAGTPTFYFAHPLLDPEVKSGEHSSIVLSKSLGDVLGGAISAKLEKWQRPANVSPSRRGFTLLKAILPKDELLKWQARVLIVPMSNKTLADPKSSEATALINAVAWRQSAHLRTAGIESYSRSELMKAVRGPTGDTFPEAHRDDYVRELAAMRQVMLGVRPGFRLFTGGETFDSDVVLEQCGPFEAFFASLNNALQAASAESKGKMKWKGERNLPPNVYLQDYLYAGSSSLVYPIWLHSDPEGDTTFPKGFGCVARMSPDNEQKDKAKAEKRLGKINQALFSNDPAYIARRYKIVANEAQANEPLLLRGHASIEPLIPRLPIFDESVIPRAQGTVAGIVAVQHLMEETLLLFDEIIRRKIAEPKNITVIGKPYSSNPQIAARFRQLGINAIIPDGEWKRGSFSEWFGSKVQEELSNALAKLGNSTGPVLLLDDGGALVYSASQSNSKTSFIAVEQTSRGIPAAKQAKFPVVLVACSALKSIVEPEFVARAAISKLARYHPEVLQAKKVGIIGLGNVGGYLARYLLQRQDIHFTNLFIHDPQQALVTEVREFAGKLSSADTREKASVSADLTLKALIQQVDVVYGCTGKDIRQPLLEKHPNQSLVSLSSNDIEFATLLTAEKPTAGRCFATVNVGGKHVIAGGFPVTFDRDTSSAPLVEMQLTRALLLAGIEQSIEAAIKIKGPVALDSSVQWRIWVKWQAETGDAASDPGAKAWWAARKKENLGNLGNLTDAVGSSAKWHGENVVRFNRAISQV
jgi:hypothetical protein